MNSFFKENKKQILTDLFTFLKFPSISSEKKHSEDSKACALWLQKYLEEMGFSMERWGVENPILFGELRNSLPQAPTLLLYNHYDVQPIDPLDAWTQDPFSPYIREGKIYARGAQDNKGQVFYLLQGIKAYQEKKGELPFHIKICIDGQEESGSALLSSLLTEKKEKLQADCLLITDVGIPDAETPAITLGLRGMLSMTLRIQGSHRDLHSGLHGGLAYNPLHGLVEMLAKVRHPSGRILCPSFYDGILPIDKKDWDLSFDEQKYEQEHGIPPQGGEIDLDPIDSNVLRPTLEINGICGGYAGHGFKTVIPATASAKISCRLLPAQDPHAIAKALDAFFSKHCPPPLRYTLEVHDRHKASRSSPNSPYVQAICAAYSHLFQKECQKSLSGASIPIASALSEISGAESLCIGLGLDSDNIHAPDESFSLRRFEQGISLIEGIFEEFAKL